VGNLETIRQHPAFNNAMNTVMFHYGEGQSLSSVEVHDLVTSYIFNRGYNFIVVSYEDNSIIGTDVSDWKII
jgi:hypothetical protein